MRRGVKYLLGAFGVFVVLAAIGAAQPSKPTTPTNQSAVLSAQSTATHTPTATPAATPKLAPATPSPTPAATPASAAVGGSDTNLSNDNYYTNSDGSQVHSPADSTNGQVPAGATAQCNDGTSALVSITVARARGMVA